MNSIHKQYSLAVRIRRRLSEHCHIELELTIKIVLGKSISYINACSSGYGINANQHIGVISIRDANHYHKKQQFQFYKSDLTKL